MKTFCTNCGGGITYDSVRPNFCPDCGNPLGGTKASVQAQPVYTPTHRAPARRTPAPIPEPRYYEPVYEEDLYVSPDEFKVSLAKSKNKPVMGEEVFATGPLGLGSRPRMRPEDIEAFNKKLREEKAPTPVEINGGS